MNIPTIQRATLSHQTAIAQFNAAMALETEDTHLLPHVISAGVAALINNPDRGFYLVATIDGEPVGSLMITFEWSDWRNGLFWWIQSVYVRPDHRGKGVYRALYQAVKTLAHADSNVCGYRLYVEQENERAQKTYKSLGMSKTHYQIYEELKPGIQWRK